MSLRPATLLNKATRAYSTSPKHSPKPRLSSLSRLELDIHAAYSQTQLEYREPPPAVRRSDQAMAGEAFKGDVQLPKELVDLVEGIVEQADKPLLRTNALELYSYLRRTSSLPPSTPHSKVSHRDRSLLPPPYTFPLSLAYISGLMPSVYAATLHVLTVTRDSLKRRGGKEWVPNRVVDYGAGTGSAAWAVEEVWGRGSQEKDGLGERLEYVGLEGEKNMIELSSAVLGSIPSKILPLSSTETEGSDQPNRILASSHQLPIPTSSSTLAKLHLSPSTYLTTPTLALTSFTLSEQGTKEKRKELIRAMWDSGAEVLVVIDRGTPGGSRMVVEAREQMLMYGKREEEKGEKGAWVVAPCPHDGTCPLHHSTKSFCHFSQRVRSPSFLRHTKHSSRGEEDAKFSYVVVKRGSRPSSQSSKVGEDWLHDSEWPRIVSPPTKRSGHVILEVCSSSAQIEKHTIPKSQGRQPYYDAKKSSWGDLFPWKPKNGAIVSNITKLDAKEVGVRDKFGKGKSALKEKKRGRKEGLGEGDEEEGDYGVVEYEVEVEDLER